MLSARKDGVINLERPFFLGEADSVLNLVGLCCQNGKEVLLSGGRASH